jgi:hypothetical protein
MNFNYFIEAINAILFGASLYVLYQLFILGQSLDTTGKLILLITSLWNLLRWYYHKYIKHSQYILSLLKIFLPKSKYHHFSSFPNPNLSTLLILPSVKASALRLYSE